MSRLGRIVCFEQASAIATPAAATSSAQRTVDTDPAGAARMVVMHAMLKVEPKLAGGRGRARGLERVGLEVLAGVARTPTRDAVTELQVPFENKDAFDRRVDDLLVAFALTAEKHRCTSESKVWAEVAGDRWHW
ncbi:hypothetical protein [Burkholderia gladioli]|uniref:hypothetical protein n=1 Tax=Burkholderia gladioli TaxID=28095 RepID=UPI0030D2C40A